MKEDSRSLEDHQVKTDVESPPESRKATLGAAENKTDEPKTRAEELASEPINPTSSYKKRRIVLWSIAAFLLLIVVIAVPIVVVKRDSSNDKPPIVPPDENSDEIPPPDLTKVWTQLGPTLNGSRTDSFSGTSLAMSADGRILARGVSEFHGPQSNKTRAGYVHVYRLTSDNQWEPMGRKLVGEAVGDAFGGSTALSSDRLSLTVGADGYDDVNVTGRVYVYQFNGSDWQQLGQAIDGVGEQDYMGRSVAMSSNGTIVAGGAFTNVVPQAGRARIYRRASDNQWVQIGRTLVGKVSGDFFGWSMAISHDGLALTVGAHWHGVNNVGKVGRVYIYRFEDSDWQQVGQALDGIGEGSEFGYSVAMSSDGQIVAGGAPGYNYNYLGSGHVRVYRLTGNDQWEQIGRTLSCEASYGLLHCGHFGRSLALSSDGLVLAVGDSTVWDWDDGATRVGGIYIYRFDGSDWQQLGKGISGTENYGNGYKWFGRSVAMSSDGGIVAGSESYYIPENGESTGGVRVFSMGQI